MKNLIAALLVLFVLATSAYAGSCHGNGATTEEVDVTVKTVPGTAEVEVDVVEPATVVAPPASGALVRKNARKEKRATIAAAREGRKAARFASKASDAAGQQTREEVVVKAYEQ